MDLTLIRTGLYDTIRAYDPDLNVYPYPDPQPEPPCVIFAWPVDIDYHATIARCVCTVSMTLTVMSGTGDLAAATRELDQHASSEKLILALEQDTVGGWSNLTVTRATNWREVSEVNVLAYDLELVIQA